MGKSVRDNNPLILDESDGGHIKTKQPAQKQQANNSLILGAEDSQFVKKKAGGKDSAGYSFPTPSELQSPENINQASQEYQDKKLTRAGLDILSQTDEGKKQGLEMPEQWKDTFVQAHNGNQTSDLNTGVLKVLNDNYPQSPGNAAQNALREHIFKSVQDGDIPTISKVKQGIIDSKQQQILKIKNSPEGVDSFSGEPMYVQTHYRQPSDEQNKQIQKLQNEINSAKSAFDAYTVHTIVNKRENVAQIKAEMSPQNVKFKDLTLSAENVGTEIEKTIGINKTTPNTKYERTRAGLEAVINNFSMDANDLMTKGIKSKNPDLIKQAQEKRDAIDVLISRYNNLDNQFPDVGIYKTARVIGDVLAETNPNRLITTKSDVEKAARILEERNPGFLQSHGKFVDIVAKEEGSFLGVGSGPVPQGGIIGGLKSGVEGIGYSGAGFVASPFGMTWDKSAKQQAEDFLQEPQLKGTSRTGIQSTKVVYDKENKAYRENPNEEYGKWNWNSSMYSLGKGIPTLAEWIVLDKGLGAIADVAATGVVGGLNVAGKEIAATTNAVMGAKNAEAGFEAIKLGGKFKETAGLFSATYVTSFDENRKMADNLIDDKSSMGEAKKNALAHLLTLTSASLFSMAGYSPTKAVESVLAKNVGPDVLKFLENTSFEKLSKDEMNSLIKDKIWPRIKAMVQAGGKNVASGAKLGGISVVDQKIKDLAGLIVNPKKAQTSSLDENLHSFVDQTLLMTLVGLPGMLSEGMMPHSSKDALYQSGLLWPQHVDRINESMERGEIEPQKANQMIAIAKTMGEEVAKVEHETNDEGLPLSTGQKRDLAVANFRKRAAAMMEENGQPVNAETVGSESDKEIKSIKAVNNWQKIEETPVFKSVSEVDKEGKESGKPAAMDEIDPTKKYSYEKDGETVTTNGAKLITHLETGDIHEKAKDTQPQVEDTKSKVPEDQKAEGEKVSVAEPGKPETPIISQEENKPIHNPLADVESTRKALEKIKDNNEEDFEKIRHTNTLDNWDIMDVHIPDNIDKELFWQEKLVEKSLKDVGVEYYKQGSKTSASNYYNLKLNDEDTFKLRVSDHAKKYSSDGNIQYNDETTPQEILEKLRNELPSNKILKNTDISEEYHKQKNQKNITNPELIKAVEDIIQSPQKQITDGNKEGIQKINAQESGSQESPQSNAKGNEGDERVLNPQEGADKNVTDTETAPSFLEEKKPEHTVKLNEKTGMHEVITPEGDVKASFKDEKQADKFKDQLNKDVSQNVPRSTKSEEGQKTTDNQRTTGIRDSIVNSERVNEGLKPLVKEFSRSWSENWNQLKANIRDNNFNPRQFIEEVSLRLNQKDSKGRRERIAFTDYDYATLLFDRLNIQNNLANARDVIEEARNKNDEGAEAAATYLLNQYNNELRQNDQVGRELKSESGRALSAIQMMTNMDGQLVSWSKDLTNLYRGQVPEGIKNFVERIENEYKEKAKQLQEHHELELKRVAEEAFKKAMAEVRKSDKTPKGKISNPKSLVEKLRVNAEKVRKSDFGKAKGLGDAEVMGVSFDLNEAIAKVMEAIADGIEKGQEIGKLIKEAIEKHRSDEFDKNEFRTRIDKELTDSGIDAKQYNPEAQRASLIEDIKSISKENDATNIIPDAVKPLRQLMNNYVKDGVKTLDELVTKTHDDLKDTLPDVEEKDIRDAFSGYGIKPDTEGTVKSQLSVLKDQARLVSQYQELLKKPPNETEAQQQKRLVKAEKIYKEVSDYMKKMGIDEAPEPTTEAGRKAVALDASKRRMKSIIDDLNKQISEGERKQRNSIIPDAELNVLREESKRLSVQLSEIESNKLSPEQKIKQVEDAINRQIFNYEKQIKEGVNPLKPKEERPNTKQIEELRNRKNELKKEVNRMREDMNPRISPQEKALAKYNEGLEKKITGLEKKIADKNFEPPQKEVIDFSRNEKSLQLENRLKKLQGDYYSARKVGELLNREWYQKGMSLASSTKRAFVLSGISTFGRLGAAVMENSVFKPIETISGVGVYMGTKLGFATKLSAQADRYGITSLSDLKANVVGEGKAWASLVSANTWKNFVSDVKNGYSELSLMYSDHQHASVPKEFRDHWQNIEHGLEFFGRAHGAVKGISKRMEFNRAYVIRKEAARRKGMDVNNPVVTASIGAMAYKDAMRGILMEDNRLSKAYQDGINKLQKGGFGANVLALTFQEMMPIVKIPTNLILNAGRATFGTPLAGGVIALRGIIELMSKGNSKMGISKLTAEESDALLRNLRMGNVGMALMTAGFLAPNLFGASHFYQKGVDQPEGLDEGDVRFFGAKIPKWLADNPYLVTMKIGASLKSTYDYYQDKENKSFFAAANSALIKTGVNAMKETPILGTPSELIKWMEGNTGDWFMYSQIKSTLEPRLLQEMAEWTDNENNWYDVIEGKRIKRKPESIGEALETGIPGLREKVGEK
jgi:hypothetical protein